MNKDREAIIHAVQMDPLCAAVCSLQEIREMCGLLFERNRTTLDFDRMTRE